MRHRPGILRHTNSKDISAPNLDRGISPRRLAAARRAIDKANEAMALLPEFQVTETLAERCARYDAETVAAVRRWRNADAKNWKCARLLVRTLTPDQVNELNRRRRFNRFMPKTAVYLSESIQVITKQIDPEPINN